MNPFAQTALSAPHAQRGWSSVARLRDLLLGAVVAWSACMATAADTSAAAAAALKVLSAPLSEGPTPALASRPDSGPAGQSITVQKGESIDAVIRRGLPGVILNEEFLRQALAKANPRIFPKGRTYPVRPGTVLLLPSAQTLREQVLAQYPQTAALLKFEPVRSEEPELPTGPDKRRWVRFP